MDFEGYCWKTGPGANIQHLSFCFNKRGRDEGIKKEFNDDLIATGQTGEVHMMVPLPQFIDVGPKEIQLMGGYIHPVLGSLSC